MPTCIATETESSATFPVCAPSGPKMGPQWAQQWQKKRRGHGNFDSDTRTQGFETREQWQKNEGFIAISIPIPGRRALKHLSSHEICFCWLALGTTDAYAHYDGGITMHPTIKHGTRGRRHGRRHHTQGEEKPSMLQCDGHTNMQQKKQDFIV